MRTCLFHCKASDRWDGGGLLYVNPMQVLRFRPLQDGSGTTIHFQDQGVNVEEDADAVDKELNAAFADMPVDADAERAGMLPLSESKPHGGPLDLRDAPVHQERVKRALGLFLRWNKATGCLSRGSSYEAEVASLIEDAVYIGAGLEPEGE